MELDPLIDRYLLAHEGDEAAKRALTHYRYEIRFGYIIYYIDRYELGA
jgi:hypothetical protein